LTKSENIKPNIIKMALEYLHDVPKCEGIDEAKYVMEGLTSLIPSVLQKLLESCKSIIMKLLTF
jgi:hypothetical protein